MEQFGSKGHRFVWVAVFDSLRFLFTTDFGSSNPSPIHFLNVVDVCLIYNQ